MSRMKISLRLVGEFNELEAAASSMTGLPFKLLRKGETYPPLFRIQGTNVLMLELAK